MRYFHASPTRFAIGDTLVPPMVSGVEPNYSVGRPPKRVYMSDDVEVAGEWAMHLKHLSRQRTNQPEVFIYEVQPHGRVYQAYLDDMEIVEYHAPTATVVALVDA